MDKNKLAKILIIVFAIVIVIAMLGSHSIADEIDRDSRFKYSTSITSRYSHSDRANVYTTNMSVPETARHIIDEKHPKDYTDLDNEESIQLTYDDHYILVYKGEGDKTYVQVSSRKFIQRNGYYGLYRPHHRNIIVFYDRSYKSRGYYRKDTSRYGGGYYGSSSYNKSSSSRLKTNKNSSSKIKTNKNSSSKIRTNNSSSKIRSGSTGTRKSTGGGISFGK